MGDGGSVAGRGSPRARRPHEPSQSMGDGGSVAGMVEWARIACPALRAVLAIEGRWGLGRGVWRAAGGGSFPPASQSMGDGGSVAGPSAAAARAAALRLAIDGR